MLRYILAAALAVVPAPAVPQTKPDAVYVAYPLIEQVICDKARGTAFFAGGHLISVAHVTNNRNCKIRGLRFDITQEQGDFSASKVPIQGYKINCDGFEKGETVYAVGYAKGRPVQRLLTLQATGEHDANGMAILAGYPTLIPGMSGGPIYNKRGEVVGTNNMYNLVWPISLSQELKDTSVCD